MGLARVLDCVKKYGAIQASCQTVLPCGIEANSADAACRQQATTSLREGEVVGGGGGEKGVEGGARTLKLTVLVPPADHRQLHHLGR